MTEKEAIKRLQTLNIILTNRAGNEEDGFEKIFTFSDITAICMAIQALEEIGAYRELEERLKDLIGGEIHLAVGTIEEFKALKEKNETLKALYEDSRKEGNNLLANARAKAIDEAIETSAKAICIGCGYLDGHICKYKGGNCSVSKPMLEVVVKALEKLKGGGIDDTIRKD